MCKEIKEYKKNHDFKNYFNLDIVDNDAEELSNKMIENYNLKRDDISVPIRTIAGIMGFNVEEIVFQPHNYSGMIGISPLFLDSMGNEKNILLNESDSDYHRRFTLAHELAHYIFDYDENNPEHQKSYINYYITGEEQADFEKRANRFAAGFLMPRSKFVNEYEKLSNDNQLNEDEIKHKLSEIFKTSVTAIGTRIKELNLA